MLLVEQNLALADRLYVLNKGPRGVRGHSGGPGRRPRGAGAVLGRVAADASRVEARGSFVERVKETKPKEGLFEYTELKHVNIQLEK
ncbi:MAG TPA: hypothetical protein VJX71_04925 [Methylomirabilota bacterium]|nr:hypothetical protein [Methylomirabilota bacterium]